MDSFYKTHQYLVKHVCSPVRRGLMDEIDWNDRLIGIKGTRGVGKTTFLLSYAKEFFGEDRSCLYINLNNFYFTDHTLIEFAERFIKQGGKVLLIDQIFKHPDWSRELRYIYDNFKDLKVVFTGSSVMRLKEENPDLSGIVASYFLRGFSFREYLNLKTGSTLSAYTFEEILSNHKEISNTIKALVNPEIHFQSYLHHGFYPFFLEKRNYSENLLKTVNMMIEVDILFIKQIELKYLHKIKLLLNLLAKNAPDSPNVSQLSNDIMTSRATVMNYIKYLKDARVINLIYKQGEDFPKKPTKVYLHNTNLIYAIKSGESDRLALLETFFINAVYKGHTINQGEKNSTFLIDEKWNFRIERRKSGSDTDPESCYFSDDSSETGPIPIWLFGFLY
ncbi:MAG: AAA family ATPase [Bacteroidales bacterium]|nr:AAA family ATPase [Bacteroidales bacterium]